MANQRGIFNTAAFENGIKKLDVRDVIFNLQPDDSPFFTILGKVGKSKAVDTTFSWFEDDVLGNYTRINKGAGYLSTDTLLIVDAAGIFQVYDIVEDTRTKEKMLIIAIDDAANTITVKRAWGTTIAYAIVDDDYIYKLGSAMSEGYTVPDSLVTLKTKKSNYVQIFSKTVQITETAEAIDTYGGNRRNYERNKVAVELKREIESQMLWGEPKEDLTGSHPRRQTGGILYFLGATAPTLDMSSASLTESAFEGWLKDVFLYSSEDRYLFTGPLVISQISQFASGKQRVEPGKDIKYGIRVVTYKSALGNVQLVNDRHFLGPHAGEGLCLKTDELVYRYLQGQDWSLTLNNQPKNVHYAQDEYSATIGLELHHAELHGILKNVA